ncbi:MAG: hypothetical protein IH599_00095, partial [Bacteroidales bacterium]|nr:hypothetical protein [Bacteroidales bacterium]
MTSFSSPQYGNGDTLTFIIPPAMTGGSFEILAIDTTSDCERLLDSVIVFTVNPIPQVLIFPDTAVTLCAGTAITLLATGGATYQWTGGPATAVWTVSPNTTTNYHVVVTSQGCTADDSVTINVNPLPLAVAGPDTVLCIGDSVQLFSAGGTTYQWSPLSGLSSPGIANPVAQPLVTTKYFVTVSAMGCSALDSLIVNIDTLPLPLTTPDTVICAGASINLSTSGGQTYLWNTVPPQTLAMVTVSPLADTLYHVTVTSGSCSVTDSVRVDVTALPLANAGSDTAICAGDTAQLSGSGGGVYSWGPAATLSAAGISNPLAFPAGTTLYTLTVTANGCSASDAVAVQVISLPPANAGPDISICEGDSTQLTASGGTSYAWSHGPVTPSTWVMPSSTTTYVVTVTSGQCSATDQVEVSWKPLPLAQAGPDDTLCAGDTISLSASGGGTYVWTPAAGLSSNTSPNALAYPAATTAYQLVVTLNGCTDTDSLTLRVLPLPVANAGADTSICSGDTAWLTASGGTTYAWSTLPVLSTASIGVHPVSTTTYTVSVSDGSCSATDAVTVTVNPPPQLILSQDTTICNGDTAYLTVSGATTYSWNTIPASTAAALIVTPSVTAWYTVTASNGTCQAIDSVRVTVVPLPLADAGADTSVCEGDSVRLQASGGTTYLWSPSPSLSSLT